MDLTLIALLATLVPTQAEPPTDEQRLSAAEHIVGAQQLELNAYMGYYHALRSAPRRFGPPDSRWHPVYGPRAVPSSFPQPMAASPVFSAADERQLQALLAESGAPQRTATNQAANEQIPQDGPDNQPKSEPGAAAPADEPLTPRQQAVLDRAQQNLREAEAFRDLLRGEVTRRQWDRQAQLDALQRAPRLWNGVPLTPPQPFTPYPAYLPYYGW